MFDKQQQRVKGKKNAKTPEKWSYHLNAFDERCVQMQLLIPAGHLDKNPHSIKRKRRFINLDLFGVCDQSRSSKEGKMEAEMIDNILRQPVNYGCDVFERKVITMSTVTTHTLRMANKFGAQEIMSNISNIIMERTSYMQKVVSHAGFFLRKTQDARCRRW